MGKYFGTDGFRGEAGVTLTSEQAYGIGRFLGHYYKKADGHKVKAVIGKDTRLSGYMLESAMCAGLTASGADAYILHVTTTPSVSYVAAGEDFDCGIMISASHNPYMDNGIKLLNSRGEKMEEEVTDAIEAYLDGEKTLPSATGKELGRVVDYAAGRNRYIGYLISVSPHSFRDFRVGLDAANGASWMIAKAVFDALGAKTYPINVSPSGVNINENAGSTCPEVLAEHVKKKGLDVGFAFDGDADRCIAVDNYGQIVTGDGILYLLAKRLKEKGELEKNTVVTTVMANRGLYKALAAEGIGVEETAVGDRFVYEAMRQKGYCLGGEQSGHVILSKFATTGDGILTAIKIMEAIIDAKMPLSTLCRDLKLYPQITKNLRVDNKDAVVENEAVLAAVAAEERMLGGEGRILLRKSGTEPVIRIMAEASTEQICDGIICRLSDVIRKEGLL